MLLVLFLQLVLCASYARVSYGDYGDYVFEDLGRKSTDGAGNNFYFELGKKFIEGVKTFADIKPSGDSRRFDPSVTQEQVHLIESLLCPFIPIIILSYLLFFTLSRLKSPSL